MINKFNLVYIIKNKVFSNQFSKLSNLSIIYGCMNLYSSLVKFLCFYRNNLFRSKLLIFNCIISYNKCIALYSSKLDTNYINISCKIYEICKYLDSYIKHNSKHIVIIMLITNTISTTLIRELGKRNIILVLVTNKIYNNNNILYYIPINVLNIVSIKYILNQLMYINYISNLVKYKSNNLVTVHSYTNNKLNYYIILKHKTLSFINKIYYQYKVNTLINFNIKKSKHNVITTLSKVSNFYRELLIQKKFVYFLETNNITAKYCNYTGTQLITILNQLNGAFLQLLYYLYINKYNWYGISLYDNTIYNNISYYNNLYYNNNIIYKIIFIKC